MSKPSQPLQPSEPIPFLAVGNMAVGVIAIGNAAFGVVAIGLSLSCGVVAIGMNSVGVLALGLNAGGPLAFALINAIGVVVGALVNALGGLGTCLLNEGITPVVGIVLAVGFFLIGTAIARKSRVDPAEKPPADFTPLDRLAHLEPGRYRVRATVERSDGKVVLASGSERVVVEVSDDFARPLEGKRCELAVEIVDEFVEAEGDYRSAPDKRRRFVLADGRVVPRSQWTRADLAHTTGRWLQLGSIATGGLCIVTLAT